MPNRENFETFSFLRGFKDEENKEKKIFSEKLN